MLNTKEVVLINIGNQTDVWLP